MRKRSCDSRFYHIAAVRAAVVGLAAALLLAVVFCWTITKSDALDGVSYWHLPGQPLVNIFLVLAGLVSLFGGGCSITLAYGKRMARLQRASDGAKRLAVASLTAVVCSAVAAAVAVSALAFYFRHIGRLPEPYDDVLVAFVFGGEFVMLISGAISLTSAITALILRHNCAQKSTLCNVAIVMSVLQFGLGIGLFLFLLGGFEAVHESVNWYRSR